MFRSLHAANEWFGHHTSASTIYVHETLKWGLECLFSECSIQGLLFGLVTGEVRSFFRLLFFLGVDDCLTMDWLSCFLLGCYLLHGSLNSLQCTYRRRFQVFLSGTQEDFGRSSSTLLGTLLKYEATLVSSHLLFLVMDCLGTVYPWLFHSGDRWWETKLLLQNTTWL